MLKKHFAWIASHYPTAFPGDPLLPRQLTVCLTFDDATFDFYHLVYPLLKRYQLKAVLAVPTAFISPSVSLAPQKRLNQITHPTPTTPIAPSPAFCSWEELKKLSQSPLIEVASHSVSHRPLTAPKINLVFELEHSKRTLESALCCSVNTFVYPYGRFNPTVHQLAQKKYSYIMRLGSAANLGWNKRKKLLYRIPSDALTHFKAPFSFLNRSGYLLRFFLNGILKK
ncbi:MAG: polysaccharide deacetylase family protein [Chlamydiota bacterium]